MITKKTALKEAGRFAKALDGPIGRRPMQRVVAEFRPLLNDLRASGASWTQIAALLASAGVRTSTGQHLSDGVLRAMVSRAERELVEDKGIGRGAKKEAPVCSSTPPADGIDGLSGPPSEEIRLRPERVPVHSVLSHVGDRIKRASALRSGKAHADRQ